MSRDRANILRPAFVRDVNKIMNIPYYTRYADKTQVFSLHKNDDNLELFDCVDGDRAAAARKA